MAAKTAKQKAAEAKAKKKAAAAKVSGPAGSTVTEVESTNELEEAKRANRGKGSSIENFLQVKKEEEEAQRKATSSDLEVLKNVSHKDLVELREARRVYGWDPKTRTACVLKLAFVEKQKGKSK